MTFEEAQAYLDDRAKWGIRPGTERIQAIVKALGHPQRSYPVIHVAGTNGKYSVASMIASILGSLGLTVGVYTSPHLEHVRERIAIGREPIAPDDFAGVLSYLRPYLDVVEADRDDHLTYFETLTAMAFEWFFDRGVHVAVVEAGLGGEYDATNVAEARVAVVTNVGSDHLTTFGDLRTAAWEKAGVIKEGTIAITGVADPELLDVVAERARERGAEAFRVLGVDVDVSARVPSLGGQTLTISTPHGRYEDLFLPLFGPHQATNAALAVAGAEAFAGEELAREPLADGLALTRVTGRMEVVGRRPLIVVDGAHNPPGADAAVATLRESFTYGRLLGVVAMVGDKSIEEVVGTVGPLCDLVYVARPRDERGAPVQRLVEGLETAGVTDIATRETVADALADAVEEAAPDDLVFVFGSLYTIGEALSWLRNRGVLPQG